MTDTLPTFFTPEVLALFWHYVKMFLGFVEPAIMLFVALFIARMVIGVIIDKIINRKSNDKDDDDDETEYYGY